MPPTKFIAVQCVQCSTMQVKQQKKSSNKWTCVICNQKQSVLKVYAQAFMAKDVRQFVTSFNMSRKFADERSEAAESETLGRVCDDDDSIGDRFARNERKRRTDWNEYLDVCDGDDDNRDPNNGENQDAGKILGPKFVTVLPSELFKKPKLKNYPSGPRKAGREKLLRPSFSKRNTTNKRIIAQAAENDIPHHHATGTKGILKRSNYTSQKDSASKICNPDPMKTSAASKWNDYMTEEEEDPEPQSNYASQKDCASKTCNPIPMKTNVASKWNDYVTEEEEDPELKMWGDIIEDQVGDWGYGEMQTPEIDDVVEEDIHPDFR